jgi:thiamine-monophosphate kinase
LDFYNLNLIGGDTTSSGDKLFLSLTVIGKRNKYLLKRSGAKVGDIVCLSREVGFAKLSLLQEIGEKDFGIKSFYHYLLKAESDLGNFLGKTKGVTSCIDISDGLISELNHIAIQSNVRIVLEKNKLPLNNLKKYTDKPLNFFYQSGEEFALIFTVNNKSFDKIKDTIKKELSINIINIGYVDKVMSEVVLKKENNKLEPVTNQGYEHII